MEKKLVAWNLPVDVQDVPDAGFHLEIDAPDVVLVALAKLANVREITDLRAVFDLNRRGAGVHVSGQVEARVGQTCVVSLEPMESKILEPIDLSFAPVATGTAHLVQIAPNEEEPAEPLIDGKIDLGVIATEFLLLGIDPYPRKPGVEFSPPQAENVRNYPFAGLEVLKKRLGRDPS
jgi:hypothetical protein